MKYLSVKVILIYRLIWFYWQNYHIPIETSLKWDLFGPLHHVYNTRNTNKNRGLTLFRCRAKWYPLYIRQLSNTIKIKLPVLRISTVPILSTISGGLYKPPEIVDKIVRSTDLKPSPVIQWIVVKTVSLPTTSCSIISCYCCLAFVYATSYHIMNQVMPFCLPTEYPQLKLGQARS